MPRKLHKTAVPVATEPQQLQRRNIRSPQFFSVYANDVQLQTTPWDMRFTLGEVIDEENGILGVNQLGELRMSPQLAKRLAAIMAEQLKAYEMRFGEIP